MQLQNLVGRWGPTSSRHSVRCFRRIVGVRLKIFLSIWSKNFPMTCGQILDHLTHLDKRHTMTEKWMSYFAWVKLLPNKTFFDFFSLEAQPLTSIQIWGLTPEKKRKKSYRVGTLICSAVALLIPEMCVGLSKTKCGNGQNLTIDDLWWPGLWPNIII